MSVKRVLSGIRATGRLHLGNYLGAVKGMLALENDPNYETFYMVADLHTITTPYDPAELKKNIREVVLDYLAAGLNPEKSTIFVQSHVPEHIEFSYLLSTVTSIAKMQHLPTYKEKVKQYPNDNTMALLYYPILMAADILLYKTNAVPVGIDQEPHLEITREIARKMNSTFGLSLLEPVSFTTTGQYIPSLKGEGKMSKSVEGSYINLTDNLEEIKKALSGAPTDSGKGTEVPTQGGVANLLTLVEQFQGKQKREEYEQAYLGEGLKYSELKDSLAQAIFTEIEPIQKKRKYFEDNPEVVEKIIKEGAIKAKVVAHETLTEAKKAMGLI
jgi:tryptophanyl-tRNA synthetase